MAIAAAAGGHGATGAPGEGPDAPGPGALGVGIDAEQIARFEKFAAGARPWRLVYSPAEAAHLAARPDPARAFAFAFCCKEALCKALGAAYPFRECTCLYREDGGAPQVLLAPALRERAGIARVVARFDGRFLPGRGECLVEVRLERGPLAPSAAGGALALCAAAGAGAARLETVAVAEVAAARAQLVEEHFAPAEVAGLGRRHVQSLAGFLALKRALAGLGAAVGAAARPRDFELGHLASGAPLLVAAPPGFPARRALVSIAHTRAWAYALAALGGGADELLYCDGARARG